MDTKVLLVIHNVNRRLRYHPRNFFKWNLFFLENHIIYVVFFNIRFQILSICSVTIDKETITRIILKYLRCIYQLFDTIDQTNRSKVDNLKQTGVIDIRVTPGIQNDIVIELLKVDAAIYIMNLIYIYTPATIR